MDTADIKRNKWEGHETRTPASYWTKHFTILEPDNPSINASKPRGWTEVEDLDLSNARSGTIEIRNRRFQFGWRTPLQIPLLPHGNVKWVVLMGWGGFSRKDHGDFFYGSKLTALSRTWTWNRFFFFFFFFFFFPFRFRLFFFYLRCFLISEILKFRCVSAAKSTGWNAFAA